MVSIPSFLVNLYSKFDRALVFSTDQLSHDGSAIIDKSDDYVDRKRLQALSLTRKMELIAVDFVAASDLVVVQWIFIGCTTREFLPANS